MPQTLSTPPADMPQEVIDFRTRTPMPDFDVDALWNSRKGFLEATLADAMAEIVGRLRKRYRTPFDAAGVTDGTNPRPEIVVRWLARLSTPEAYLARGYNPQDQAMQWAEQARDKALDQIKEAADAENGLYDLPLLPTGDATGISKGGPLGYAEPSPYDWQDVQRNALNSR